MHGQTGASAIDGRRGAGDASPVSQQGLVDPLPALAPELPVIGAALPLLRDPVRFLASCRRRLGDTFLVRLFGREILFVFSAAGVRSLWAAPEDTLSKGFADFEMIRAKVPEELFQGRRTRPHDLFSRDDVEEYLKNVIDAVDAELDALGDAGEVELFGLTRRVGHRVGLASWGGVTGEATRYLADVIRALDALDTSDAFVHPVKTLVANLGGKRDARRALRELEALYEGILRIREQAPPQRPDLFDRLCGHWEGEPSPAREIGIARDAVLVHLGSMSNLFAAKAWTVVHLLESPERLERVRAGDRALLTRCAHESIRLHQRSIVLRRALRETSIADETATYRLRPGAFVATMMPNTNTSAAPGLDRFDPDHYDGGRFLRTKELETRELVTTFGHGAHACPAMRFSIEAIQHFASELVRRFALEPRYAQPGPLRNQIGGIARADRPCRVAYRRRVPGERSERGPSTASALGVA